MTIPLPPDPRDDPDARFVVVWYLAAMIAIVGGVAIIIGLAWWSGR